MNQLYADEKLFIDVSVLDRFRVIFATGFNINYAERLVKKNDPSLPVIVLIVDRFILQGVLDAILPAGADTSG